MSRRGRSVRMHRWFWRHVRGYMYELCQVCGRPVSFVQRAHEPVMFWRAPDPLWFEVMGSDVGVLCPACFTARATDAGINVHWSVDR